MSLLSGKVYEALAQGSVTMTKLADDVVTSITSKLPLSGGTLTGPLTLSGDGTNPLHPVTKQQLDGANYPSYSVERSDTQNLGTALIPSDGTVPLITEGAEILTLDVPVVSGAVYEVLSVVNVSTDVNAARLSLVLFAGSTHLASSQSYCPDNTVMLNISSRGKFVATTTGTVTFSARTGYQASGSSVFLNRTSNTNYVGGAVSSMSVRRIA